MDNITLATLGGGGLEEQFQMALEQVLWNINDPNTRTDAKRKIQIVIELKPNEMGEMGYLRYSVTPKLVAQQAQETAVALGMKDGTPVAAELRGDPRQMSIDDYAGPRLAESPQPPKEEAGNG